MPIEQFTPAMLSEIQQIEAKAYTNLIISNYGKAEQAYREYYEFLRAKEDELPSGSKYHKGTPLHNWGISLIAQNKVAEGFKKIILAYIEDLLNALDINEAFGAPAYKTLTSYPLIDKKFLHSLYGLAKKHRDENDVPRDPEEILKEIQTMEGGRADLSASLSVKNTDQVPIIQQLTPDIKPKNIPDVTMMLEGIGPKEKRVFIGGNHFNIVLLQHIKEIVESIDDYKAILVADISSSLNTHDKSIEALRGCSRAIFEISISDGHLMEIERATDFLEHDFDFLLLYQGFKTTLEPKATEMLEKFKDKMARYTNLSELVIKINNFLSN